MATSGDVQRPTPTRGVAEVLRLARHMRGLRVRLSRMEEDAARVASALAAIARAMAGDASGRLASIVEATCRDAREAQRKRRKAQRAAARDGVSTMEVQPRARGAALVRIGDGQWMKLAPLLATLLAVLASGARPADSGFPAWQAKDAVLDQLARKRGRRPTRRALTEAVYRLRRLMDASGVNPFLLQVDARRGLRLRLKGGSLYKAHPM
jgi:hypothetical protein